MKRLIVAVLALVAACTVACPAHAASERKKVDEAIEVIQEIGAIPEKGIPPALLKDAHGIVIIPGVIKAGFIVGGRYGTGVLLSRSDKGVWGAPLFVSIAGGSFGWQIGATSTDIILVLKSKKSIEGILKGKFTLGADAAVAAGPVGRSASAATDVTMRAEILSYSRSRGLFAGLSLEGAALLIDHDANESYYGREPTMYDILAGRVAPSPEVKRLQQLLAESSAKTP